MAKIGRVYIMVPGEKRTFLHCKHSSKYPYLNKKEINLATVADPSSPARTPYPLTHGFTQQASVLLCLGLPSRPRGNCSGQVRSGRELMYSRT